MTLPNDPEEQCGYGAFSLPKDHPFLVSCKMHDRLFESRDSGFKTLTRKQADKALLDSMLKIARERKSFSLRLQAYAYYALARAFGGLFW